MSSDGAAPATTRRRPQVFTSLHGYRAGWLRGDLIAGLTVWAMLVPEALAYASIVQAAPRLTAVVPPGRP